MRRETPQGRNAMFGYIHHVHITEIKPTAFSLAFRDDKGPGALEGSLFGVGWGAGNCDHLRPSQAPHEKNPIVRHYSLRNPSWFCPPPWVLPNELPQSYPPLPHLTHFILPFSSLQNQLFSFPRRSEASLYHPHGQSLY